MTQESIESAARVFNGLTLVGALLLWFGFFMLGIIARRYEIVFKKWTGWKAMMVAPSGILVYVFFIVAQILPWRLDASSQKAIEMAAYVCLVASALSCLILSDRFFRFIRNILSPAPKAGA